MLIMTKQEMTERFGDMETFNWSDASRTTLSQSQLNLLSDVKTQWLKLQYVRIGQLYTKNTKLNNKAYQHIIR